jgi:hypothetical protein
VERTSLNATAHGSGLLVKRYAPLAAPDDAGAWIDMSGFWPTRLGTYKNSDAVTGTTKTATGETAVRCAFAAKTLTGQRGYVVGAVGIWEVAASGGSVTTSTLTDRTGGVTIGSNPHVAQYGNATIIAMGAAVGTPTVVSTGGNFAALGGGSPAAEIVLVAKGFVILANYYDGANTYNDGWWCSDRTDYTTWTPAVTNEAAFDRLLDTNGPIVSGCVIDDTPYLFKTDSIYRGTYIGYPFVWSWDLVVKGIGAVSGAKNAIVAAGNTIIFAGNSANGVATTNIMQFDGVSQPRWIDQEVGLPAIASTGLGADFLFDDSSQTLYVNYRSPQAPALSAGPNWSYNFTTERWGKSEKVYNSGGVSGAAMYGDVSAIIALFGGSSIASPHVWIRSAADTLTLQYPGAASTGSAAIAPYVESHRYGSPEAKTFFNRLIPILRSRSTRTGGTPVCSLSMKTYRERHDSSPQNTFSITESTFRHQFDLGNVASVENYASFKVTFADIITEIDDLTLVEPKPAGKR